VTTALAQSLEAMGIRSPRVLDAASRLDRGRFVPPELRHDADADWPLPIGFGQTISQPFVVAYMTERLGLEGDERVLEVGTGSGYQTALLALLARQVHSVEIIPELAERARAVLLDELGLANVSLRVGDGALGWPEEAPFDRILVGAAGPDVPLPLVEQLARGGRMILPVGPGPWGQVLKVVERSADGEVRELDALPVRFVPLTHGRDGRGTPVLG
jgi:protein-L-isoaspartate(D-aspartate) O-methyltransferase